MKKLSCEGWARRLMAQAPRQAISYQSKNSFKKFMLSPKYIPEIKANIKRYGKSCTTDNWNL